MDFNTLVKTELFPILQKLGFEVLEEFKDVIRFQSSKIEISIVFNVNENSSYISIGEQKKVLYPLNDGVIRFFFNSLLQIEQVTPEKFVRNLSVVFQQAEGIEILSGNIEHLVGYIQQEINDYTIDLMYRQALAAASNAWEISDYKAFIKSLDGIDIEKIPQSFQLKYKIAKRKL